MEGTLLKKALLLTTQRKKKNKAVITQEHLDLALAVLRGDVSYGSAGVVLGKSAGNVCSWIPFVLTWGLENKRITITPTL